jgi:hypothetical protein
MPSDVFSGRQIKVPEFILQRARDVLSFCLPMFKKGMPDLLSSRGLSNSCTIHMILEQNHTANRPRVHGVRIFAF